MKRTVLIVAVAALCVAGSAVAQDRSGQYFGSGGRAEDGDQILGSGNAAGQTLGSGGFLGSGTLTTEASGGLIGSGTRTEEASGGLIGSGTRTEDGGYLIGGGRGGYYGSGLSVHQFRLLDGSSVLVVSSDEGVFVIPIEE